MEVSWKDYVDALLAEHRHAKQIIIDDPSGNPVELFEPTIPEAKLDH